MMIGCKVKAGSGSAEIQACSLNVKSAKDLGKLWAGMALALLTSTVLFPQCITERPDLGPTSTEGIERRNKEF